MSASPPPPLQSLIAVVTALVLALLGDFLLWPATPGLSLGIFALLLLPAIFGKRPATLRQPAVALGALAYGASAVQTMVELSFSNIFVLLVLLVLLLAETLFPQIALLPERVIETLLVLLRAPTRWGWVAQVIRRIPLRGVRLGEAFSVMLRVIFPAALLTVVFAILLGQGNSILGLELQGVFTALGEFLARIDLSISHLLFWIFLATFMLALVCPFSPLLNSRLRDFLLTRSTVVQPPEAPGGQTIPLWRSWVILAALNLLFGAANTIDAAYLWIHRALRPRPTTARMCTTA